jgi:hypothetical protein
MFWRQTPASFRAVIDGVARRIRREERMALRQAYNTAAFNALTKTEGGLQPFDHYARPENRAPTAKRILATLRDAQSRGAKMRITAVPRTGTNHGDHAGIAADQPRAE